LKRLFNDQEIPVSQWKLYPISASEVHGSKGTPRGYRNPFQIQIEEFNRTLGVVRMWGVMLNGKLQKSRSQGYRKKTHTQKGGPSFQAAPISVGHLEIK
jgi:hypothetical protein